MKLGLVFFCFVFPKLHSASPLFPPLILTDLTPLPLSLLSLFISLFFSGLPPLCCLTLALDCSERLSNLRIFFHPHANHPTMLSLIVPALPPLPPPRPGPSHPQTAVCNQSKRQLKLKGKRSLWRWMEGLNINRMRLT